MQQGRYIILEGGDGAGKEFQTTNLLDYLKEMGIECIRSREPGSTREGEQIRKVLKDTQNDLSPQAELFLFEAARTEFFRQSLLPALERGVTVVADRSYLSTLAYQGYGGGMDLELINRLNEIATFGIRPDLAVIIDVDAEVGQKEREKDRISAKGLDFHRRVNQGYREIARKNPENMILLPYMKDNPNAMQSIIRYEVMKRFFS